MKTIKFFSFAVLISLAWVACKNENAASTETTEQTTDPAYAEKAGTLSAEVLATNKSTALENLTAMRNVVGTKIKELETALASAPQEAKANLNSRMETMKKFMADIQAAETKVNESTIESWSTVSNEVDAVYANIKMTLTGTTAGQGGALTQ